MLKSDFAISADKMADRFEEGVIRELHFWEEELANCNSSDRARMARIRIKLIAEALGRV